MATSEPVVLHHGREGGVAGYDEARLSASTACWAAFATGQQGSSDGEENDAAGVQVNRELSRRALDHDVTSPRGRRSKIDTEVAATAQTDDEIGSGSDGFATGSIDEVDVLPRSTRGARSWTAVTLVNRHVVKE